MRKFTVAAEQKGTAFRRTSRTDLNWIFTVQTERVVAKDNTVAIADRSWQIDKTRFRHTLAGSTVTIHEHLDGKVSIRFGPHVVGQFTAGGEPVGQHDQERRGKGAHRADDGFSLTNQKAGGSRRLKPKPDRSLINQTGHLDLLTTMEFRLLCR